MFENIESLNKILELGAIAALFFFCIYLGYRLVRWLLVNVGMPVAEAHIEYLKIQTETGQETVRQMSQLSELEREIREAIKDSNKMHTDPDSPFSSVRTNASLALLAEAVNRIAKASDIDIDELIVEIKKELSPNPFRG